MVGGITVPTDAYATVEDVQHLLPGRTYGPETKPSIAAVEFNLKSVAQTINARLRGLGFTPPLTGTNDVELLRHVNSIGAAWMCEAQTVGVAQGESALAVEYRDEYRALLKDISDGKFEFDTAGDSPNLEAEGPDELLESGDRPDTVFINSETERKNQF